MEYFVQIVEIKTGNEIKELGPYKSERMAEKAESGVNRNLNHDLFVTWVVPSEN